MRISAMQNFDRS